MRRFTNIHQQMPVVERPREATEYTYQADDGEEVIFASHPTEAFQVLCLDGDPATVNKLYAAFIAQGLKQHQYAGGFDEAIKTLVIE